MKKRKCSVVKRLIYWKRFVQLIVFFTNARNKKIRAIICANVSNGALYRHSSSISCCQSVSPRVRIFSCILRHSRRSFPYQFHPSLSDAFHQTQRHNEILSCFPRLQSGASCCQSHAYCSDHCDRQYLKINKQ